MAPGLLRRTGLALTLGVSALALACGGRGESRPAPQTRDDAAAEPVEGLAGVALLGCEGLFVESSKRAVCMRRPGRVVKIVGALGLTIEGQTPALDDAFGRVWIDAGSEASRVLTITAPGGGAARVELREVSAAYLAASKVEATPAESLEDPREAGLLRCSRAVLEVYRGGPEILDALADTVLRTLAEQGEGACRGRLYAVAAHAAMNGADMDLARAEAALDALGQLVAAPIHSLDATLDHDYYGAGLEQRLGHLDEPVQSFGRARVASQRVEAHRQTFSALAMEATALARMGRFVEAEALRVEAIEGPLAAEIPADLTATVFNTLAWVQILEREEAPSKPEPRALLDRALAAAHNDFSRARARLNGAVAAAQSRRFDDARAQLEAMSAEERGTLSAHDLVFVELTLARIEAGEGGIEAARSHLEAAETLASLGQESEDLLRALLTRAELEVEAGRQDEALASYARVAAVSDELASSIAPDAGRSLFASSHSRAVARHAELSLALGRREEAMCTVLGARARHLRGLVAGRRGRAEGSDESARAQALLIEHAERRDRLATELADAWALSAEEFAAFERRAEAEGEALDALEREVTGLLERAREPWRCEAVRASSRTDRAALLTMFPRAPGADGGRLGWRFFFARGEAITVVEVEEGSAEAMASRALGTLAADGRFAGLEALTVVPTGVFVDVDFHALAPLEGSPTWRYALGLGGVELETRPRGAVVLAGDPDGLAEAPREIAAVRERLGVLDLQVEGSWALGAEATPLLLHYSGHGSYGGLVGWDSALLVGPGRELDARGLVAYGRAPAIAVLGACDAGTSDPRAIDGGMNMATAFLLAGARMVIAPRDPVDDSLAREFAELLYARLPAEAVEDGPEAVEAALSVALSEIQRQDPRFAKWRAWVP